MAKGYSLPVTDTVISAWKQVDGVKSTFWFCLLTLFIVIYMGANVEKAFLNNGMRGGFIATSIIVNIINLLFSAGLIHLGILRANGQPISYKMFFYAFNLEILLYLIGLIVLQTLLIMLPTACIFIGISLLASTHLILEALGIVLTIIATISCFFLAVHMMLSLGFILDKKIQPFAAIKQSFIVTKGNFWRLAAFVYMISVLLVAGMMMFFIGVVWTLPLWYISYGAVYRNMSANNI